MSSAEQTPNKEAASATERDERGLVTPSIKAAARVAGSVAVLVLLLPMLVAGLLDLAFSSEILVIEVLSVILSMTGTCLALWWAFARGRVLKEVSVGRLDPVVLSSAIAVGSAASFGALTGLLYLEGGLGLRGWDPEQSVVLQASEFYLWHLADTVPALDIPANLQWEQPFEFEDRLGGVLLVVFTGIVILPLVQVVRLIAGYREPYHEVVVKALRTELPGLVVPGRSDGGALLTGHSFSIQVDAVCDVWTEDEALRRFQRLQSSPFVEGPAGYILVADVLGDRARERIEKAFAEATRRGFPAMLAVWRPREPPAHLANAVHKVKDEIESRRAREAHAAGRPGPISASRRLAYCAAGIAFLRWLSRPRVVEVPKV